MVQRARWKTQRAFILATVGAATGLGNIWRFPYVSYANGGGAFLIPYLLAYLAAGIPLIILELGLGQRFQRGAPGAWTKVSKKMEGLGWWSTFVSFVIAIYFAVIVAWIFDYLYYSLTIAWKGRAADFFLNDFLGVSSGPSVIGSVSMPVVVGLVLTWLTIFLSIRKGPELVSRIVRITVPMPVILLIIMIIRGITLDGAMEGVTYYLTPDFASLMSFDVWVAAFTQVFFSVGVGMAIVISFASYKYVQSDITKTSIIITASNAIISVMAGFAVFSVLGYLAFQQGVTIPEVATGGTGLAFVAFPTAIELMPVAAPLFGIIFFLTLLTFALDSAFSFVEAINTSIADSWNISTGKSSAIVCTVLFFLSLFFATDGGFYWIEIVDHFINNYGVTLVCLGEALFIGWAYDVTDFRKWITAVSEWRLGRWWDYCMRFLTPLVIVTIVVASAWEDFLAQFVTGVTQTYGDFPAAINNGVFLAVVLFIPIIAWVIFPRLRKTVVQEEG